LLRADQEEHFVSVFLPNVVEADPKVLADGVSVALSPSNARITMISATGRGKIQVSVRLGGEGKQDAWRVERTE
jgi:hypothetical protein